MNKINLNIPLLVLDPYMVLLEHKLLRHQQYNKQLIVVRLYSDASRSDPRQDAEPKVYTADTFPHPGPLLEEYGPKSKRKIKHYYKYLGLTEDCYI